MIFPIGDDQVKGGHFPFFSYAFIVFNLLVFMYQLQFPNYLVCDYGAIPQQVMRGENYFTLFSSMFLHADWWHLIGNLFFLWVFADNIEATIGNLRFLLFYLGGGVIAVLAHIYFTVDSSEVSAWCCIPCENLQTPCTSEDPFCPGSIPMVGASGAISAVMGAYLILFPGSMVKVLFLIFPFRVPAFIFLGFWIVQQLISGTEALRMIEVSTGVAWWAHIGGFVFGIVAGFFLRSFKKESVSATR